MSHQWAEGSMLSSALLFFQGVDFWRSFVMLKRWMVAAGLGMMLTAGTGMAFGQGPLQVAAAEADATQA